MKKKEYFLCFIFIVVFFAIITDVRASNWREFISTYPSDIQDTITSKCKCGEGGSDSASKVKACLDDSVSSDVKSCLDFHSQLYKSISSIFPDIMEFCKDSDYFSDENATDYKACIYEYDAVKSQKNVDDNKCINITNKDLCNNHCAWNDQYGFCSPNGLAYLKCGDADDVPNYVPKLASYAVTLLKTVTPIVLIIVSIIQLVKAISSNKEEEIRKVKGSFVKKIIIAAIIFLVVSLVQFIMLKVAADDEKDSLSSCLSCLLNGTSKCGNIYYKDGYGWCYYLDGKVESCGSTSENVDETTN